MAAPSLAKRQALDLTRDTPYDLGSCFGAVALLTKGMPNCCPCFRSFCMLRVPGVMHAGCVQKQSEGVCPDWHILNSGCEALSVALGLKRSVALGLKRCQLGRMCLISRGMNPFFTTEFPHPITHCTKLVDFCDLCKKRSMRKKWSEKTQWLVRCRISAISLQENPAQGFKRMLALYMEVTKTYFRERNLVPGWSCGPFLGDSRPGERSGVLRFSFIFK
eukprot:704909-Pelagomonas_calceolata.AAC.1